MAQGRYGMAQHRTASTTINAQHPTTVWDGFENIRTCQGKETPAGGQLT
jgi:hypothetical protein